MENKAMNPIIYSDFPDPDIIRVDDTYYMASTTMHFMPGCDILRSYDLIHWELLDQVYEELDKLSTYRLEGANQIYGKGMWAPTLRYHEGKFYLLFTSNDTHKTHLFCAEDANGPWKPIDMEGFYYDSSLFFDDDGRVYIVHGQKTLHLTELRPDLSGPLDGGLERIIAEDEERIMLGFEGSHMYKRNGKYYIFTCHILSYGSRRKSEVCFVSDSLENEFQGKCVIDDDCGYHNLGIAQGGMIDTPNGEWYAFMFQDRGSLGRAPVLMPMHFENDFPVLGVDGKVPLFVCGPESTRPGYRYAPINDDDDFNYIPDKDGKIRLKRFWQFNHVPTNELWSVTKYPGNYWIKTDKISKNIMQARNTLTQRMTGPDCAAEVTLDCSHLKEGDVAGIAAFQGSYGLIGATRENGEIKLVMMGRKANDESIFGEFDYEKVPEIYEVVSIHLNVVRLRIEADFENKKDEATFYFEKDGRWIPCGITQKLYFKMDHFTGCRFGLFLYATKEIGGEGLFSDFRYKKSKNSY